MYFMGYSKWLLLSSRLVAGEDFLKLHCSIILNEFCLFVNFSAPVVQTINTNVI